MALIPQLVITLLTIPLVTPSLYGPKDQVLQHFTEQMNNNDQREEGLIFDLTTSTL